MLRPATAADLPAINDIYNHYVANSTSTYDEQPISIEERTAWFTGRLTTHPVIVACLDDAAQTIIGFGALSHFRAKHGYRFTVENSVYVRNDHQRGGIGSAILADLIERARTLKLRAVIAVIDSTQTASLALHTKHGFTEVGRFPQIGHKFGKWLDVVFLERVLEEVGGGPRAVGS